MDGMDSMDSMENADHSHHPPTHMDPMPMTFFTSTTTPLFSDAWAPDTTGQYALTCLFLILLCLIFRCLLAARCNLPTLMTSRTRKEKRRTKRLSACLNEEDIGDLEKPGLELEGGERWSKKGYCAGAGEVVVRAVLDTSLAVVSYFLMLAVMTMNTGYFLSVVAGTFVGSVLLGGYTAAAGH